MPEPTVRLHGPQWDLLWNPGHVDVLGRRLNLGSVRAVEASGTSARFRNLTGAAEALPFDDGRFDLIAGRRPGWPQRFTRG